MSRKRSLNTDVIKRRKYSYGAPGMNVTGTKVMTKYRPVKRTRIK